MKKSVRIISLVLLTAYYFAGLINSNPPESLGDWHFSASENQGYFTDISSKFHYPQKSENLIVSFGNFPAQNLKNTTDSFGEILENTIQIFRSRFQQYLNFRKTVIVHFRKSDLIFPFHYFW